MRIASLDILWMRGEGRNGARWLRLELPRASLSPFRAVLPHQPAVCVAHPEALCLVAFIFICTAPPVSSKGAASQPIALLVMLHVEAVQCESAFL